MFALVTCAETGIISIVALPDVAEYLDLTSATLALDFAETVDCGDYPRADIRIVDPYGCTVAHMPQRVIIN